MATPVPTLTELNPSPPLRARVPFLSTSFATNLWYFALLWPLWWVLGIEQFLLPFFILFELGRFLITSDWQLRINTTILFALLLAMWWLAPIFWADREFLDIFLKEAITIWAQVIILVLLWNRINTRQEWQRVVGALLVMAFYMVIATATYLSGIWRGEMLSLVGRILPRSIIESSAFFSSISYRHFGELMLEGAGLFSQRTIAFTLSFSSLSMVCLLLIPMSLWQFQTSRGYSRAACALLTVGLLLALMLTESRIAYAAFVAGALLYLILRLHLLRQPNRPLTLAIGLAIVALGLVFGFIALGFITDSLQSTFVDIRPGSWLARYRIYEYTLELLPEHIIAGWGVPVRIPGMVSEYSAGTHSSYLGMLFQHGIIGLLLYLGLWLSLWRVVIRGVRQRRTTRYESLFWAAIAFAFFAFNLREVADTWWWDLSLLYIIWLQWGLVMTAPQALKTSKFHG